MPVSHQDVIQLARELSTQGHSEAALRGAVGRFYYGTLLLVRHLFIPSPSRKNAHTEAASVLGRRTKRSTGQQYLELFDLRGHADYDAEETFWDRKVVTAGRLHDHIVEELRRRSFL